ncbi:DUF6372 family protein [Nocardia sp. NPDC127579]|uniref:DUF6372 family protein n=1 Tax=Nocardia sp. NPDC127579 TaxID=3345402 RepID=UPI0036256D26
MTAFDPLPVLTVEPGALFQWEQNEGGGCRCVCALYHPRRGTPASVCLSAAEPGHLIRVQAGGETVGPLPVCSSCYTTLGDAGPNRVSG